MENENKVKIYSAPKGAVLQQDYFLKVREKGNEEWKQVPVYQVKVDMHDVREASMAYFDFQGCVEVEVSGPYYIYRADIRPLSRNIVPVCDTKTVRFELNSPENLSIELNRDRYHNLHLFAGGLEPEERPENMLLIQGNPDKAGMVDPDVICEKLNRMPKGRTLVFTPGIHYITECTMRIPSDTNVYIEGGAILIGTLICERVKNVRICGKGMFYLAKFERFSGLSAVRISHSENITIENLIFVNPPHYTVFLGGSRKIQIKNIKSFSCEGWSDGIDMMSCEDVLVDGGFLRTSDDCVAVYGSRWCYFGATRHVVVKNLTVWADVAHPLMMGTHGDHEKEGDVLEDIVFENIDILEHNEYQAGYLGCMALNAGDKNVIQNVRFQDIRIEPFLHGKVFDIQVKWNKDYNPAPGHGIRNISFRNIYCMCENEVPSVIAGYNEEYRVQDVSFEQIYRNGKQVQCLSEANIEWSDYTDRIVWEGNVCDRG